MCDLTCFCDDATLTDNEQEIKASELVGISHDFEYYDVGYTPNTEGSSIDFFDLTKRCVVVTIFWDLVSSYLNESKPLLDFCYVGINKLSIDYDL